MPKQQKHQNEFEPFLNECQTYVWEWYIPEHKVRFGIPSLNRLWIDDKEKNIQLATMLERVHPDDIQKVLVRKTSPLFRLDKMFEVDLRLNVADELMPDGKPASGKYEWYGFRGKTIRRDAKGQPTYVRGVAINLDQRYRAQMKLLASKDHQLQGLRHQNDYCMGLIQEVYAFMRGLAENANSLISFDPADEERVAKFNNLQSQAERILSITDKYRTFMGDKSVGAGTECSQLFLWEHLAELQQVYSLKAPALKFNFCNRYDHCSIYTNVKLLNLLIDNILNLEQRSHVEGLVTFGYRQREADLALTLSCSRMPDEGGVTLSVCRILARRLWGDVTILKANENQVVYQIVLPLDARTYLPDTQPQSTPDTLNSLAGEEGTGQVAASGRRLELLFGIDSGLCPKEESHFKSVVCPSYDKLLEQGKRQDYDLAFIDSRLGTQEQLVRAIRELRHQHPDMPIVVTADEASRPLHRLIRQENAQYLLTNPLTLRKVNLMIRHYLGRNG